MGKFDVLKVIRPIRLCEYAAAYENKVIHVWVNPPTALVREHDRLIAESEALKLKLGLIPGGPGGLTEEETKAAATQLAEIGKRYLDWFAQIWSAGPDDTHVTADEINDLIQAAVDTDPYFWAWLSGHTVEMILQHRIGQKKA